ncbi:hypothetical protein JTB14_005775 [Gonioctena quinquepunctata]|nr:hypothetical protein JTB14_005775 [Gonioctena quinquepunctata]
MERRIKNLARALSEKLCHILKNGKYLRKEFTTNVFSLTYIRLSNLDIHKKLAKTQKVMLNIKLTDRKSNSCIHNETKSKDEIDATDHLTIDKYGRGKGRRRPMSSDGCLRLLRLVNIIVHTVDNLLNSLFSSFCSSSAVNNLAYKLPLPASLLNVPSSSIRP